ncbi:hypothetical protein [Malaciobacter mytili]|uniref:Uncharacterized protein n=1 Tax=Malaciobacter mytili LMG 24559 TaxID=1032238 RepID=A0AAX2ADV3_9BACT|nr:hypothetical protein [Malaciobacter mytili]AXH16256.1 hypothetical protein AMYT_2733 [Malaciobacter mytili LMG 24559]RXI42386.1 hypothetical protein CRU99_09150 [Malaciobacter mytili]RXK13769.1 hypothetical protein CP985_12540 [Malaciobacter mytili LMG 24559]
MNIQKEEFEITNEPITKDEKKLVQKQFNTNVAFYVHLKEYNNNVREELLKRVEEVFFFAKGVDWKFDSFGIEKAGSRSKNVLGYFVFRATDAKKLQELFIQEFKDYENALKISCSIAKYEKIEELFFEFGVE